MSGEIEVKFKASVPAIIGLYDGGVFDEDKTKVLLSQFSKEKLIDELLNFEEEEEGEVETVVEDGGDDNKVVSDDEPAKESKKEVIETAVDKLEVVSSKEDDFEDFLD